MPAQSLKQTRVGCRDPKSEEGQEAEFPTDCFAWESHLFHSFHPFRKPISRLAHPFLHLLDPNRHQHHRLPCRTSSPRLHRRHLTCQAHRPLAARGLPRPGQPHRNLSPWGPPARVSCCDSPWWDQLLVRPSGRALRTCRAWLWQQAIIQIYHSLAFEKHEPWITSRHGHLHQLVRVPRPGHPPGPPIRRSRHARHLRLCRPAWIHLRPSHPVRHCRRRPLGPRSGRPSHRIRPCHLRRLCRPRRLCRRRYRSRRFSPRRCWPGWAHWTNRVKSWKHTLFFDQTW